MDWMLFWTAVSAIGQVIAIPALVFTAWSFYRSSRIQHYDDLDSNYQHLLELAIDRPFLKKPGNLDDEQRAVYDAYAYMMWNFMETTIDRIGDDQFLNETWLPVILHETAVHRDWMASTDNQTRFKSRFLKRINDLTNPSISRVRKD